MASSVSSNSSPATLNEFQKFFPDLSSFPIANQQIVRDLIQNNYRLLERVNQLQTDLASLTDRVYKLENP